MENQTSSGYLDDLGNVDRESWTSTSQVGWIKYKTWSCKKKKKKKKKKNSPRNGVPDKS